MNQPAFILTLKPGMNVQREDAAAIIAAALQFVGIQADVKPATLEYGREHFGFTGIIPADATPMNLSASNVHVRYVGPWDSVGKPAQNHQDRGDAA